MKKQFSHLLILIFCGCSSIHVYHDHDKSVDFSLLTSYQYDFGQGTELSELEERRFVRYSDSVLGSKGFVKTDRPDFWIVLVGRTYEQDSRNRVSVGVGGGAPGVGVAVGGSIPVGGSQTQRELVVGMVKAGQDSVFWESVATHRLKLSITPPEREALMRSVVEKLYKKFPSKK